MLVPFIKALYGLGEPSIAAKAEHRFQSILKVIEEQALGSQVYAMLKQSGQLLDVPKWFRERLLRIHEACLYQNLLIKRETMQLLRQLEASGIAVIPLKGTCMAERFFGNFAARGTSDIDLLVRWDQLEEAIRIVRVAGYDTPSGDSPVHYHTEWMKTAEGLPEPLVVELHWSFVPEGTAAMDVLAAWKHSEALPGFALARGLSAEYTFYTLCLHGASHQMESFKHVLDLVHMLCMHGERIDLDAVCRHARSDRTYGRVRAALSIVYREFPELARVKPLPFRPQVRYWKPPEIGMSTFSRFLFALGMLDTWRFRLIQIGRLLFPARALAAYSVEGKPNGAAGPRLYFRLYRQRLRKLFGG